MEISKRQLQDEEVTAYHGGPHSFDKFSTQYMGTGEGAHAFGWGLYFTDLEDIAKYYAETIGDDSRKIWKKIEEIFYTELGLNNINNFNYPMIEDMQSGKINIKQAINRLKWANLELRDVSDERMAELFNKALNLERQKKYIYKVTLHKGKTPEQYNWLEWDKKPNENLIERLNLVLNKRLKDSMQFINDKYGGKIKNGAIIYKAISRILGGDKEASLFLLENGIDGIKYPTGTLSNALGIKTDTTRGFNYVVFDENAVNIEKQTQFEGMEITKGELEEAKKARTKLRKKSKGDRCTRIAKSKYDVWPSAYSSGAVVRCRQGKIWKDLKEEDENQIQSFEQKVEETTKALSLVDDKFLTDKIKEQAIYANYNLGNFLQSIPTGKQDRFMNNINKFQATNPFTDEKIIFKKQRDASEYVMNQLSFDKVGTTQGRRNIVATVYNIAKENGSNPELVNAVEKLLSKQIDEKWSEKYKKSIDCNNPKGFSQKAHCKGKLKEEEETLFEIKKTDFSKEKEQGLHGWFARQGGKGKSKGWVDCNTCRDGKCKSCGRKEGESRSKYPACRPTPSACKTKGKGKSWGKKSVNEEFPIQSLYKEKQNMEIKKKDIFDEDLVLKRDQSKKAIYVQSDLTDDKAKSQETYKNKEALKSAGFKWDSDIKSWKTDDVNFNLAKKTIETINKKEYLINQLEELEEIVANSEDTPEKPTLMSKIDMYINDLANATDEASVSSEIRRYLTFFSKFRVRSVTNTWLIYIQSGGKATKVEGFRKWEKLFHRRVKKGAKGYQIFVPLDKKITQKDDETGEEITTKNITKFGVGYVFDISQTEPIDERGEIPETPKWYADLEPTERSIELYKYFIELCEDMGIEISKSSSKRGERGYSAGNKINISSEKEGAGEISTLVHEIAHELMHWKKSSIYYQENTDAELRELQAESVSYVVLKNYDLPTEHHPAYLALWKANKDKIKNNLKVISSVASFIISEIDKIEKRNQKNKVMNEQVFKDVKKIFKRFMK